MSFGAIGMPAGGGSVTGGYGQTPEQLNSQIGANAQLGSASMQQQAALAGYRNQLALQRSAQQYRTNTLNRILGMSGGTGATPQTPTFGAMPAAPVIGSTLGSTGGGTAGGGAPPGGSIPSSGGSPAGNYGYAPNGGAGYGGAYTPQAAAGAGGSYGTRSAPAAAGAPTLSAPPISSGGAVTGGGGGGGGGGSSPPPYASINPTPVISATASTFEASV